MNRKRLCVRIDGLPPRLTPRAACPMLPAGQLGRAVSTHERGRDMATATLRAVSRTEKGHRCEFHTAAADAGDALVRIGALLEELSQQNTYNTERAALVRDALIDRIHEDIVYLLDTVLAKVIDYELLED